MGNNFRCLQQLASSGKPPDIFIVVELMLTIGEADTIVMDILVVLLELLCCHDNKVRLTSRRTTDDGDMDVCARPNTSIHLHPAMRTDTYYGIALHQIHARNFHLKCGEF